MITSQSLQSPFRSNWCQRYLAMESQALPPPVVQASTQTTLLMLSLSQLVITLMVFVYIHKKLNCLSIVAVFSYKKSVFSAVVLSKVMYWVS